MDEFYLAKPLRKVGETDIEAIKGHIFELAPSGRDRPMSAGMRQSGELFQGYPGTWALGR